MSEPNDVGGPVGSYPASPPSGDCDLSHLEDAITAPQAVTVDNQNVTERSLADIIAMDKYIQMRKSLCGYGGEGWGRVGKSKVVPPSTTGDL